MAKVIKENQVGCWIDASHQSAETLDQRIIETMNTILVMAGFKGKDMFPVYKDEQYDGIADDAISFVNWQICGNGDYSESPELLFEVYDNSLFLTNTTEEN